MLQEMSRLIGPRYNFTLLYIDFLLLFITTVVQLVVPKIVMFCLVS